MVALRVGDAEVVIDTTRAAITAIATPTRSYVDPSGAGSILRLAVPLDDYAAHYLECGHTEPVVETENGGLRLTYDQLRSDHLELGVRVELSFTPTDDGLVLRAMVRNDSDRDIPQVVFPQVLGLTPRTHGAPTRLQLPGRRMEPFVELAMAPHDLSFLEVPLQEYIYYGCLDLTMKWLDFGDADDGFTLYWRSPRYTTQGLLVQRPDRATERLDLRWAQYPSLGPGQSWDSDEVVLLPHTGDWYAGAEAFRQFVKDRYVYDAPRHVREALAIRSLWPAVRNAPPRFRYRDLPEYAAEVADPSLGVGEVVFWHWWLKNGYPIVLDGRLGTEEELRAALDRCREMGVPISLFVSHHILRDTDETDPDWLHRNKTGQAVVWNWTYSSDYIPKFPRALRGDALDGQGVGALPGLAGDRPERVPPRARPRRRVDLLRRLLRLGRAELQPERRRRAGRGGRAAHRVRARGPADHPRATSGGQLLGRVAERAQGPGHGLHVGLAERVRRRRLRAVPLRVPAVPAQRQRRRPPAGPGRRVHGGRPPQHHARRPPDRTARRPPGARRPAAAAHDAAAPVPPVLHRGPVPPPRGRAGRGRRRPSLHPRRRRPGHRRQPDRRRRHRDGLGRPRPARRAPGPTGPSRPTSSTGPSTREGRPASPTGRPSP